MSDIQNAASSIVSRVQTVESTTGTLIDAVLLGTLQLMYSDLLAEVMQSPTHKLFYLKSKIDKLNNGQTLST